jgi:serine/threonine kinase PknH
MPVTERLPATLGPYHLLDRLGAGGMGVVHLARDRHGGLVAVKVLKAEGLADADGPQAVNARRRLAREVETMRRVRSPYVAEVLDADLTGEFPYIVTRFVPGRTLEEMVRGRGPLPGEGLRRLGYGMAEALAAIHAAGVVHRDLKPGNVMLTDDRPVVIDFGIAQAGDATRLTQTGMVMGTPGYLAPEVIEGQPSSPAADVHSWGATMAFAATGRAPYGSGSYETVFYRIVSGQADLSGVPAGLAPLVSAALSRDPAARPPAGLLSAQVRSLDAAALAAPGPYSNVGASILRPSYTAAPRLPPGPPPPAPRQAARDVADLLPPVSYAPARRASGPAPAPARAERGSGINPRVGLAFMVCAVALTVVLPVAGLIVSLAAITLLRAADRSQSTIAVRRSVRGPRASDPLVALAMSPLAVVRALLAEALLAPLALLAGLVAYVITMAVTHSLDMQRAGAYAAAAVVAWYGVGPGSGKPRRQLNRMAAAIARSPATAVGIGLAAWALAAAAILFAASQAPYYWPMMAPHLPALHGLVSTVGNWLLHHAPTPTFRGHH